MRQLAIIGGGAAGLAAAVEAARSLRASGADEVEVVVYEADDRVGRSILATGNGRCNFSNARIDPASYRNGAFVGQALDELRRARAQVGREALPTGAMPDPVHAFFSDLGLVWREEGGGRLYPLANKASSVLDVLRAAADDWGVREACGRRAVRVDAPGSAGGRFRVRFDDGAVEHPDAVIVAAGGRAAGTLDLPDGLASTPGRAVLGPVRTDPAVAKPLNNIRVRCAVSLAAPDGSIKAREEGELLFRDYGVSGIAVFNLSRFAQPGDVLLVDLLPSVRDEECERFVGARRKKLAAGGRPLSGEALLRGMLLAQVARAVLEAAGLDPHEPFGKADVPALARALKGLRLEVRGVGDARQCQVMRGGYAVEAFDPRTCEARGVPGLHLVGEALDVDAPCGGYNLHWAWASGILAGRAAASRLREGARRA